MAVGALTEEIAENLEEAAEVTRRISGLPIGYLVAGIGVGAAVGFYFGYRYNRKKIRAEILAEAEIDIAKIREFYRQKSMVAQEKPTVEELIEEKGYQVENPLIPPTSREDPGGPALDEPKERLLTPPVPITPEPTGRDKHTGWNYAVEQSRRSFSEPYIIHQDEFNNDENEYSKVVYTYFAKDDVLVDEDNHPLPHSDIIVGQSNLRFGHGSDDENVVFVRNDKLEIEMEICRLPRSYEEEVLGLEHNESN